MHTHTLSTILLPCFAQIPGHPGGAGLGASLHILPMAGPCQRFCKQSICMTKRLRCHCHLLPEVCQWSRALLLRERILMAVGRALAFFAAAPAVDAAGRLAGASKMLCLLPKHWRSSIYSSRQYVVQSAR